MVPWPDGSMLAANFGLQLDSLVDMVSLGVSPMVLVFFHLQNEGIGGPWVWPIVMLIPLAGAFRLARFNLLPAKEESRGFIRLNYLNWWLHTSFGRAHRHQWQRRVDAGLALHSSSYYYGRSHG